MSTQDETYKKEDKEIQEKESEDHVVTTSLAVAGIILANAYFLINFLEPVVVKIDDKDIWKMQLLNVGAWILMMSMNYCAVKKNRMNDIAKAWKIAFKPARWAFRIWPVIYMLNICFVVYMALPCSWVKSRNNDLIFG
jgi:hypothetical protein